MATAALSGRVMSMGGAVLTEPMDCTVHVKRGAIDVTNSGTPAGTEAIWKEYIEGSGEWSVDGSGNFVLADFTAVLADINTNPGFLVLALTMGAHAFTGNAFVTSCDINGKTEDRVSISISWQGTGPLV